MMKRHEYWRKNAKENKGWYKISLSLDSVLQHDPMSFLNERSGVTDGVKLTI
ncbi:MAG: hypothetical protein E3K37_15355 [Candidatus Kuenenia sp.]|nr:hypothetical protein [Candidatus Kuenenia hertensis]